jgi:hypothetical protein
VSNSCPRPGGDFVAPGKKVIAISYELNLTFVSFVLLCYSSAPIALENMSYLNSSSSSVLLLSLASFRCCPNGFDAGYELLYDSVHNLHTQGLGFCLFFGYQLQLLVNTFQDKPIKQLNCETLYAGNRTRNRTAIRTQNRTFRLLTARKIGRRQTCGQQDKSFLKGSATEEEMEPIQALMPGNYSLLLESRKVSLAGCERNGLCPFVLSQFSMLEKKIFLRRVITGDSTPSCMWPLKVHIHDRVNQPGNGQISRVKVISCMSG